MKKREKNQENARMFRLLQKRIISDRNLRRTITGKSHWWFFHIFLSHYVLYPTAPFQHEMLKLGEKKNKLLAVMAFRGSGKSTILNLSYALWSILGVQQKKFVLIISRTQDLVATHIRNIRQELESNKLLRDDLGPFKDDTDKFGIISLVLPYMNARITGISREQSIRGIRHGPSRPDLIICDDLEDSSSVETNNELDTTYQWFKNEVVPAGDRDTKIIVLGNLLHKKSLLMNLRSQIAEEDIDGIFRAYTLIDDKYKPLWPGKFQSESAIEELKTTIADQETWKREYLLVFPYDTYYDDPSKKKIRRIFLEIIESSRKKAGMRIYSSFLKKEGFQISAPYSQEDFEVIEGWIREMRWKKEKEEEEKRKNRLPTPEEIRAEQEKEATRIRLHDPEFNTDPNELYRKSLTEDRVADYNQNPNIEDASWNKYNSEPDNLDPYD